ncbi:alpha/beta fold hydrolase [Clostridioides difficile]|uniref:alpha/beta fold hydrolase n=1 Tax=Clostridioides difficile TaxID=1496 RepID=UPI00016C5B2C|nr:alpha/beta fold hydrolase [Clostridioides difficile]OFU04779.1 lysophospholipase [Clostridium sp. HMSC19E03]OFU16202.1 lysophospholipase [Clostridium sp. HMSC19C09]OFU18069.1 lysophospholipase [Clostridium sp. HMSC19C05]OFU19774.1 lysophospholipase [Clostridium sp. HMSC19C08]OFU33298.1 lysophospholipase [Clostridium sp. HMSC19B10]OFU39052.1 lysophospholipase [Clostridium sp. HMSC19B01]
MKTNKISFNKGLYYLNTNANFNFQLNRIIMWDGGRLEDIQKVSSKIVDSESWKTELMYLAQEAEQDGRTENAIAYYRMSEFFMYDGDPDKISVYKKATTLFYNYYSEYFSNGTVQIFHVPYENITLPVMYAKAQGEVKDVILLHGGNDSYFEEFFFPMLYLASQGFDIYLFEGPGQGGVMRLQGKHFTYQWERPVKTILDYFHLENITIVGASLGGFLAPRAAAFEKRIERVVAWSVFPNFLDIIVGSQPIKMQNLLRLLLKLKTKWLVNFIIKQKMKSGDSMVVWGLKHGMYAYEASTPYEYFQKIKYYQIDSIAKNINQDILILGATQDHFIDYRTVGKEIDLLNNVRSLTFRLMTEAEQASNHCNCGNSKLVLDTISNWIMMMKIHDRV